MFDHVFNPSHCLLFGQRGNNSDDLVPIAICSSLLDGGPAWACNSSILCIHLFFQPLPCTDVCQPGYFNAVCRHWVGLQIFTNELEADCAVARLLITPDHHGDAV